MMSAGRLNLRERIIEFGALPGDSEEVRIRKTILTTAGLLCRLALFGMFGPIYLIYDEPVAGLMYAGFGLTDATHALIRDRFICEARGTVTVKGKGEMRVWHVAGERQARDQLDGMGA